MSVERIAQLGHDRQRILERLERFEDRRELNIASDRFRRPVAWTFAKRHKNRAEAALRVRGGSGRCRQGRHHRFEQRQRQRDADASQERPPGKSQF
jgi:hypothetical protein